MTYIFDPILGTGRDDKTTLAAQQAAFDAGTAAQKAAFQSSVSGDAYSGAARPSRGGFYRGVRAIAGQASASASFPNKTWRINVELPCRALNLRAIRFAVSSSAASDITYTAAAGSCSTLFEANAADGYQFAGFDGSDHQAFNSHTVKQKTNKHQDIVWSDWIVVRPRARTDGSLWACVSISVYAPGANVVMFTNGTSDSAHCGGIAHPGLRYQTYFADGDYVTANSASMPSASIPNAHLIAAVEFLANGGLPTYTFSEFGDSIAMGQNQTRKGLGPLAAAANKINGEQTNFIVSPMLSAFPGEHAQGSFRRFQQYIKQGSGVPDFAIYRPYSVNNSGQLWVGIAYAQTFIAECRQRGIIPILVEGLYASNFPSYETTRLAVNAECRKLAALYGIQCIALENVITAANAGTLLADGAHPNDAGQLPIVDQYAIAMYAAIASRIK